MVNQPLTVLLMICCRSYVYLSLRVYSSARPLFVDQLAAIKMYLYHSNNDKINIIMSFIMVEVATNLHNAGI